MSENKHQIINHPSAWKASDFRGPDDVAFDLEERHLDAFRSVVARARAAGKSLAELGPEETQMPEIRDDLVALRHEIMDGRGLVIIRGWPVDELDNEELALVYWAAGTYFGRGVSQSPMGDRLGYVTDVSKPGTMERGYRSVKELDLHTDSDDIVGLLCVRPAQEGGMSRLASSITVYNEIASTRPELLDPLFEGFYYHWFGEQPPGEGVVTAFKVPVFGESDGKLSCIFLKNFIHMAVEELGTSLTDIQEEALRVFVETAERDDIRFDFYLQPGWASFINNYTVLHSRTEFVDWPELRRRRMMYRLWLKAEPPRPLVRNQRVYYGDDGMHVDGRAETYFTAKAA